MKSDVSATELVAKLSQMAGTLQGLAQAAGHVTGLFPVNTFLTIKFKLG